MPWIRLTRVETEKRREETILVNTDAAYRIEPHEDGGTIIYFLAVFSGSGTSQAARAHVKEAFHEVIAIMDEEPSAS